MTLAYRTKPLVVPALRRWRRYLLARKVDLEFLSKRPPHAFSPDFNDLWYLYRAVRRKKPGLVLEFGSGDSTVVIAQALADNNQGHLYSIDDQRYWADVTTGLIPSHLKDVCEVTYIPTLEIEFEGIPCFRHSKLPNVIPDMIYLDGPTFTKERRIATDILDIEEKLPKGCLLIIDGRDENTEFLRKHLTRPFLFRHRIWHHNTVATLTS